MNLPPASGGHLIFQFSETWVNLRTGEFGYRSYRPKSGEFGYRSYRPKSGEFGYRPYRPKPGSFG